MFRLAHISDVHLAPENEPRLIELFSKRITGYINWKMNRSSTKRAGCLDAVMDHLVGQKPDHIAITGDLVNLATDVEISNAANWLDSLADDLPQKDMLSVIGGNHDAYVPGSLAKALRAWHVHLGQSEDRQVKATDFPLVRHIGDNVSIISCNSAEATLPFMATGYFRSDQAERLSKILEQERDRFRIVLIHHPPIQGATQNYKRLIGADLFADCIANNGAELILHGHTHLDTIDMLDARDKSVPVVCVPAAGNAPGNHKPPGGYNLFNISGNASQWNCSMESYGLEVAGAELEVVKKHKLSLF